MAGLAESYVGKYFSAKYIQQRIMNFSDEELNKIQSEIKDEQMKAQAEQALLAQQQGSMGMALPPEEGAPPQ
jgi:hypothetical protein